MIKKVFVSFLIAASVISCSKNPISGRSQLHLVPEQELQTMAATQYRDFLSQNRVVSSSSNRDAEMVVRVGRRITQAVQGYLNTHGKENLIQGWNWEYNLIEDKAANAWCMPGGKIVVYTGLLPISQNEAALAAVMGHEVSHAILQHANERVSQGLVQELGGVALSIALSNSSAQTQNMAMAAYGAGSTVGVLLPFSRNHELEADRFGLIWMAIAGYNPREAIGLWERMERASGGQAPPEFLSTHPSSGRRIDQLNKYMDEALTYYKPMSGSK
ncbi:MAG: M48 family metallopeptidase [Bacteroidetes bacterium]|nr:MAG: M48 family metallopeptidase [Bacteroidota bacterium]